jgi:hypothetical protein
MKKIAGLLFPFFLSVTCFAQEEDPQNGLIKWHFSLVSRGMLLMDYEFALNNKFTAEVGAGATYRDFIYEENVNNAFLDYRKPKANIGVEGALRFYPNGHEDFEGVYLSPCISYRRYLFSPQKELYGNGNYAGYSSTFSPGYNFLDTQFKLGYMVKGWWFDNMITDISVGFAYRTVQEKHYDLIQVNTMYGTATDIQPISKTDAFPQFLFGLKFCFGI